MKNHFDTEDIFWEEQRQKLLGLGKSSIKKSYYPRLQQELEKHRHTEAELKRTNRALRAIIACNQALIRARSEKVLLQNICRVIVETGGYCMAWVGFVDLDAEKKQLKPAVWWGHEAGYLRDVDITWDESPLGWGPTGTAVKTSRRALVRDIATDPTFAPWREAALQRGYTSVISLPLHQSNFTVFGVLTIYANDRNLLDDEEVVLLVQLADDLAYGVVSLRARQQQITAEVAQHESEIKFKTIFDNSVDAIGVTLAGIHVFVNPAYVKLFGYTDAQALIGKPVINLVAVDERLKILREIKNLIQQEQTSFFYETRGLRKDNSEFEIEVHASTYKVHQQLHTIFIVRDVTERNQNEAKLRQSEALLREERETLAQRVKDRTAELQRMNAELNRAVKAKDKFLATMSHELRTPLHAILGMSEILRDQVYGSLNEEQLNSVNLVDSSGRHLLTLINDILELAKIDAGKFEIYPEPTSVATLCETSLQFIRQTARKQNISVLYNLADENLTIRVDPLRFKEVLINLLSNAVKFTDPGGQVRLEVVVNQQQQIIKFIVSDTGIGIAEQDMVYLFKPFEQVQSSLSRRYEGTGLGLALVQRMVEMHNGSVEVKSQPGEGSCFTVSLPFDDVIEVQPLGESAPAAAAHVSSFDVTVLLAEDNDSNLQVMATYLQTVGYHVLQAHNGLEVIEKLSVEQPDIILMDIQMPHLDGLETTRRIRRGFTAPDIPIVALTALVMPGDKDRCLEAGVDAYLSKPLKLRDLVDTIEALLRNGA